MLLRLCLPRRRENVLNFLLFAFIVGCGLYIYVGAPDATAVKDDDDHPGSGFIQIALVMAYFSDGSDPRLRAARMQKRAEIAPLQPRKGVDPNDPDAVRMSRAQWRQVDENAPMHRCVCVVAQPDIMSPVDQDTNIGGRETTNWSR
jgi:hypothetical protein